MIGNLVLAQNSVRLPKIKFNLFLILLLIDFKSYVSMNSEKSLEKCLEKWFN